MMIADEPEAEAEAPIATHLEVRQEEENARRRESKQKEDDELKSRRSDGLPPIVGVCSEHTGDEEYVSFRAGHPYQMWRGRGAIFANGDVIIQWNDGGCLKIPAGNDYSPYMLSYDLNN